MLNTPEVMVKGLVRVRVPVAVPRDKTPVLFKVIFPVKAPPPDKPVPASTSVELETLAWKIPQSVEVKSPLLVEVAEGRLKVQVPVEEDIVKSVPVVELAKVMAFCLAFQVPEEEIQVSSIAVPCQTPEITLPRVEEVFTLKSPITSNL